MTGTSGEGEAVHLPPDIVAKVESRLQHTEFGTTDEYVAFVLRETLARVEQQRDPSERELDRTEVERRLESLGYLDR